MNSALAQAAQILDPTEPPRTIAKCEHGVYIGKGETRALYCWLCTPGGPVETRDVVLPVNSSIPLDVYRTMANKSSGGGGRCPQCGSSVYMRVNETRDTQRECAECGHKYVHRGQRYAEEV
jgi:Zn ribbon nucleic-acid-binding protein